METPLIERIRRPRVILGLIVILALCFYIAKCVVDAREEARRKEAIATAEGFATVIRETLSEQTKLVVQEAKGALDVTSVNRGMVFDTSQKSTVPYTVLYSVDLSRVDLSNVRFDEPTKTLFVEIPGVVVSSPNIDESKRVILQRKGWWTSRDAAEKLAHRTSKLAVAAATVSANEPEKIKKAQELARVKVDRLLELPLRASGKRDVNVVVRFPTDGLRNGERWDVSPSLEQVLAQRDQPN